MIKEHRPFRELMAFQIAFNKSTMMSTWCISFFIVAIFILEEIFGGSSDVRVLLKMGANFGTLVKEGEYFRLMSSVFLHAGYLHVFFNTYVLIAFGGFINKILGESRFLLVFLLSGISGSLGSIFMAKPHVSVGASGAIWGLFGFSLGLALFPSDYLPETLRIRLRQVTIINLLINVGVSLLPMVDLWAHFGGGAAGFLISTLIILKPKTVLGFKIINFIIFIIDIVLILIYVFSIVYVIFLYKPWLKM